MEKKFTALICDDSAVVRKVLCRHLSDGPFKEVHEATDGVQAVEMYRLHRPDIVFMDIVMPRKTGIEALCEIREHDPAARVVMASSTGAPAGTMRRSVRGGVSVSTSASGVAATATGKSAGNLGAGS